MPHALSPGGGPEVLGFRCHKCSTLRHAQTSNVLKSPLHNQPRWHMQRATASGEFDRFDLVLRRTHPVFGAPAAAGLDYHREHLAIE